MVENGPQRSGLPEPAWREEPGKAGSTPATIAKCVLRRRTAGYQLFPPRAQDQASGDQSQSWDQHEAGGDPATRVSPVGMVSTTSGNSHVGESSLTATVNDHEEPGGIDRSLQVLNEPAWGTGG